MKVEPGMPPIVVRIPNVRNFNEDLYSGVVVVSTMYDGVVLDASGTTDTNRKALTGAAASFLTTNTQYSLTFYPLNEGQLATYDITIIPVLAFGTTATIMVQFPNGFPLGLGGSVGCQIPQLLKASNNPIQCSTTGYSVTLSNQ